MFSNVLLVILFRALYAGIPLQVPKCHIVGHVLGNVFFI